MPSVMQTTRGISASIASWIPPAAKGGLYTNCVRGCHQRVPESTVTYGTKMPVAVAPVSFTASETLAKTGRPRCVEPAFLGLVPPTTLVPIDILCQNRVSLAVLPAHGCDRDRDGLTIVNGLLCVETRAVAKSQQSLNGEYEPGRDGRCVSVRSCYREGVFLVDLIMGKATDDEEAAEEGGRLTCPAFL